MLKVKLFKTMYKHTFSRRLTRVGSCCAGYDYSIATLAHWPSFHQSIQPSIHPTIYPSIWLAIGTSTNVTLIFFDYMYAGEESSRIQELETPGIRASFVSCLTAETKRLHWPSELQNFDLTSGQPCNSASFRLIIEPTHAMQIGVFHSFIHLGRRGTLKCVNFKLLLDCKNEQYTIPIHSTPYPSQVAANENLN